MQASQQLDIVEQPLTVCKRDRATMNHQTPCVLWFTGLSGSGKSSTANLVAAQLHDAGHRTYMLDGDNLRYGLNSDLGFDAKDRVENIRRVAEVSKLMVDAGLIVLVCLISPFRASRESARKLFDEGEFIEVFVDAPLMIAERRDPKGLYKKARQGKIPNFTGIDSPYEAPVSPEIRIETGRLDVNASAATVIEFLRCRRYIRP
jgi:bifunctional enzyme CysN/CysC